MTRLLLPLALAACAQPCDRITPAQIQDCLTRPASEQRDCLCEAPTASLPGAPRGEREPPRATPPDREVPDREPNRETHPDDWERWSEKHGGKK